MNTTMNTVNQTFNWNRFTATLRKEVVENRRALIFTTLCIYGLLTLLMILGNFTSGITDSVQSSLDAKTPQLFVVSILSFVMTVSASLSFKGLTTKTGRTSMFTSPSSTLEKFLTNILIYIVGLLVVYLACAQLADLTRIAILWFFKSDSFVVPGPINYLNSFSDSITYYQEHYPISGGLFDYFAWITFFGLLTNAGLYLLGSIVWPRLSFLKTFAAVYVIQLVLLLIAVIVFTLIGDPMAAFSWFADFISQGKLTVTMFILTIGQAILYYGLAWYLFKRKDVVSLKWWK